MSTITTSVNSEARKNLGIKPGDTVRVALKIQEKGKTRIQNFEGMVLARKHGDEAGGTFTVRRVASGVGVEKIFPLYSPTIDKIDIVRRAKVRRAKLYHFREKVAREVKRQMRRMQLTHITTGSDMEARERAEAEAAAAAEAQTQAQEEAEQTVSAQDTSAEEVTGTSPETLEGEVAKKE